jgi:hypothetical protein
MAEYQAGRGTTALGIIGTVLGSLGVAGNGGVGLLNMGNGAVCHENMPINRYEAQQSARIAELETEVKLRDANSYTTSHLNAFRDYVDGKFSAVHEELCQQRVYNATNTAALNCLSGQVAQLMALTKLVIPNGSICPGWGNVTVAPATAG